MQLGAKEVVAAEGPPPVHASSLVLLHAAFQHRPRARLSDGSLEALLQFCRQLLRVVLASRLGVVDASLSSWRWDGMHTQASMVQ